MGPLTIPILLGLAALTSQKPQNSNDLDKLLKSPEIQNALLDLFDQNSLGDSLGSASKHHGNNHAKHHGKHQDKNLMNIQNLNLVFKNNNLKKKPAELNQAAQPGHPDQQALREIEDAICATTGRCGCGGGRCDDDHDNRAEDSKDAICATTGRCGCGGGRCEDDRENRAEDSKDLSKLLDALQNDLENIQSPSSDLRCGCGNGQPQAGHATLRCGCRKKRPHKRTDENEKGKIEQGKKIRINDNLDVVVVKLNDLLDKNNRYQDYTRTREDEDSPDDVDKELDSDGKNNDINEKNVSPEELFAYYEIFKSRIINKLINYILDQRNDFDFSKLLKRHQEVIKGVLEKISKHKTVDTVKLEERLVSLLFGPESEALVLPHAEPNDNIYVPQWAYNIIQSDQPNPLMRQRQQTQRPRVFPLTKRQKLKLQKMIKDQQRREAAAKGPGFWRRNLNEDVQSYGAPFELDIQGLGQVNA